MNPVAKLFRRRPEETPPPPPRLLSYRVANLQGIGSRARQEDSFAFANAMDVTEIRRKGLLAVVADGMGGMEDGKLVSERAVAELLAGFGEMDRRADLAQQLRQCVLQTAQTLYGRFRGAGGTTVAACIFFQETLYWVSVGDSYIYLKRGNGLYRVNRDQNYRSELYLEAVRAGHLDPGPANADPDGHRLAQFLGKDELGEMDLSLRPLPLQDGDALVLCSDGVGGSLDEAAILDCLKADDPAEACARMDEQIYTLGRRNQDNYTALVINCGY